MRWTPVCPLARLHPDTGVTALLSGEPVAVFLLADGALHAISARDPFSGTTVLGRGLVGSAGDIAYVASPVYKQRFALADGRCLDDDSVVLDTWDVTVDDGVVVLGGRRVR